MKELPPFDKGGQGGIYPRPSRKVKSLGPPFSKGETGVVRWAAVTAVRCLYVRDLQGGWTRALDAHTYIACARHDAGLGDLEPDP